AAPAFAQIYDPSSGSVVETIPLAIAQRLATLTVLPDGRLLLAGGRGGADDPVDSVEVYGPLQ
ncbi:MAG: hypothetical protein QOI92_1074, partial [Chloroflexota bacterium]|nr:hypothetical protein [Chloroflexota bacterium]